MRDSKLIQLLQTLDGRQLSRLETFLESPYFNKNEDILAFFRHLKKVAPNWDHPSLEKEKALKKLKLSRPVNAKVLAYLMSSLLKLVESFLLVEQLDSDTWVSYYRLAKYYDQHNLPKHLRSATDKVQKELRQDPLRDADHYRRAYELAFLTFRQSDSEQRSHNPALQEAADALDRYYLLEKLRYLCLMQDAQQTMNIQYDQKSVDAVLQMASEERWEDLPAIQVYRAYLNVLQDLESTESYYCFKELVLQHLNLFNHIEKETFFVGLFNFCSRRINRYNDRQFYREYLESGRRLIEGGIAQADGHLSPWLYKNLVTVGLKTDDPQWVLDFIHEFRDQLPQSYREPIFNYNLANYHYHQKDYEQAQRLLVFLDFREVFMAMSVKSLLIKIYYETDQLELLLAALEAYRIYTLRNRSINEQNRRQVNHFIEFTRKMAKVEKWESEKLTELYEQLPAAEEILHRDWVEAQLRKKIERFE